MPAMPRPKKASNLLSKKLMKKGAHKDVVASKGDTVDVEKDYTRKIGGRKDIGKDIQRMSKR